MDSACPGGGRLVDCDREQELFGSGDGVRASGSGLPLDNDRSSTINNPTGGSMNLLAQENEPARPSNRDPRGTGLLR